MKKVVLMVFLAGLLGGCGLFGKKTDETATTQPSPVPNASPSPAATPPQPFDKDKAQVNGSNGDIDIAGLIPSRPPNQVPIKNGRTDPFAVVPVRPTIKIDPTKGPLKPPIVPVEPRSNNTNSLGPTKNTNTANNPPTRTSLNPLVPLQVGRKVVNRFRPPVNLNLRLLKNSLSFRRHHLNPKKPSLSMFREWWAYPQGLLPLSKSPAKMSSVQ